MPGKQVDSEIIASTLNSYITTELVTKSELLPLKNETRLIESGILDSLSLLKLVLFIEKKFGLKVEPDELVPENFETIGTICTFISRRK